MSCLEFLQSMAYVSECMPKIERERGIEQRMRVIWEQSRVWNFESTPKIFIDLKIDLTLQV